MYVKFSYMNSSTDLNGDDDEDSKERDEDNESISNFKYFYNLVFREIERLIVKY